MSREYVLHALTAARVAYYKALEERGINITCWQEGNPVRRLYTLDCRGLTDKYVGEITYSQKVYEEE